MIEKMEKKLGKYAIKNLALYLTVLFAMGFFINLANPTFYYSYLALDINQVMRGQIWRLLSWLIYPPSTSVFLGLVVIYVYYSISTAIQRICGDFRFNLFIIGGVLLHIALAFAAYFLVKAGIIHSAIIISPSNFMLSLFLAYMILIPDATFLLFFIIPIRAWILGIIYGVMTLYGFVTALLNGNASEVVEILASMLNLLFFYLGTGKAKRVNTADILRKKMSEMNKRAKEREEQILKMKPSSSTARHKCAVCGKTEITNPELEFRYCSKCKGDYEYCSDHLFTHIHVTGEENSQETTFN